MAQIRCEMTQILIQEELKSSSPKPPISTELCAIKEDIKSELDEMEVPQRACLGDDVISENLVSNLIENVKLDATLNEDKAIIVANSVIKTLSENIQPWSSDCKKILGTITFLFLFVINSTFSLTEIMEKYVNEKVNSENVYSAKLKCIFKRLWYCKNDTQQRNWPVYEDEDIITGYMDELLSLLLNTDQAYLENEICLHNCENVHLLIAYFQMETRRSLRLKLMDTFIR